MLKVPLISYFNMKKTVLPIILSIFFFNNLTNASYLDKIEIDKIYGSQIPISLSKIGQVDYKSPEADKILNQIATIIEGDMKSTIDIDFKGKFDYETDTHIIDIKKYEYENILYNININIAPKNVETGDYYIEVKVYGVKANEILAEKRYTFNTKNTRKTGHVASDIAYYAITGKSGYFQSKIFFISNDTVKNLKSKTSIYVIDQDGYGERLILSGGLLNNPVMDFKNLALFYIDSSNGISNIKAINAMSGKGIDVSSLYSNLASNKFITSPSLCGNGKCIVYTENNEANQSSDIKISFVNGVQTIISDDICTSPSLSPNDDEIVFESRKNQRRNIYRMSVNGGSEEMLVGNDGVYAEPKWSPDGEWIVFTKLRNKLFHVGIVRPDGTDEQILFSSYMLENPTWMPNSDAILFSYKKSSISKPELKMIDISGREIRTIKTSMGAVSPFVWTIR